MGLNFEFATSSKIIFGIGSVEKAAEIISRLGDRILLVTGKSEERAKCLTNKISPNVQITIFRIISEPTTEDINEGIKTAPEKVKLEKFADHFWLYCAAYSYRAIFPIFRYG